MDNLSPSPTPDTEGPSFNDGTNAMEECFFVPRMEGDRRATLVKVMVEHNVKVESIYYCIPIPVYYTCIGSIMSCDSHFLYILCCCYIVFDEQLNCCCFYNRFAIVGGTCYIEMK